MTEQEPRGTFACPICSYDKPHGHSDEVQAAYRDDQVRGDGWTSTVKKLPAESGWYLCLGVEIDRKQRSSNHQLSWFLWVRDANVRGFPDKVPEVLYFDALYRMWSLRNRLGDAVPSGAESRWLVEAKPRYWREVPEFNDKEGQTE